MAGLRLATMDNLRSFIRLLDAGGMAFEGAESYPSLDAALQAAEVGLVAWLKENG